MDISSVTQTVIIRGPLWILVGHIGGSLRRGSSDRGPPTDVASVAFRLEEYNRLIHE
jgi:hypothetical protein